MVQISYITQTELEEAADQRLVRRLGSDTASPGDGSDAIVDNAIERASADVESVALKGGRYTLDSLAALQTADNWALKGLVADLALLKLYERRGTTPDDMKGKARDIASKMKQLDSGFFIFGTDPQASGRMDIKVLSSHTRGRLGMVSDSEFFPRRLEREV